MSTANICLNIALLVLLIITLFFLFRLNERTQQSSTLQDVLQKLLSEQRDEMLTHRQRFDTHQLNSLKLMQESIQGASESARKQLTDHLQQHTHAVNQRVDKLIQETQQHLRDINTQVNTKLSEGFEKTHETFTNVVKRLTIIDQAQQKITELSSNVVGLQEILTDKRSRGAFGEVQLTALIHNMIPANHFALQHELSNKTRVDCMLFLPEPTGHIAIDSKFPLESYQQMHNNKLSDAQRQQAKTQFRTDIRKHIKDIASKYIVPNETADGAILFIPAEAIFSDIHAHFPELVETAHTARVWLASPTTLMAILTTARAVLKDAATREQVHLIQKHLVALSQDFTRFQHRMDKLSKHIQQAQEDVDQVHKSSRKISDRFQKIERVELVEPPTAEPLTTLHKKTSADA